MVRVRKTLHSKNDMHNPGPYVHSSLQQLTYRSVPISLSQLGSVPPQLRVMQVVGVSRIEQLQSPKASQSSQSGPRLQHPGSHHGSTASSMEMDLSERRGWCLKKGKSDKPWSKAHHSHRYFVSRSHALCYFERAASSDSELGGQRLLGIIDLREVVWIRPSADDTAPTHALDIVLAKGRTYTLVPQPATLAEVTAWVRVWAGVLRAGAIAPDLRQEAGLPEEPSALRDAMYGSVASSLSANRSLFASITGLRFLGSSSGARNSVCSVAEEEEDEAEPEAAAVARSSMALDASCHPPEVIRQGYMHKLPVKSDFRRGLSGGLSALLPFSEKTAWRRRYFQLRPSMLQWYRDDPGAGGEFLGVLRLAPDTTVRLDSAESRLRITAAGETLVLRDDKGQDRLGAWEADLQAQIYRLSQAPNNGVTTTSAMGAVDYDVGD